MTAEFPIEAYSIVLDDCYISKDDCKFPLNAVSKNSQKTCNKFEKNPEKALKNS
jgi:hypothetical protein